MKVVRREEAPEPGWYPDPVLRARLRWWDGSDWTSHERVRPTTSAWRLEHQLVSPDAPESDAAAPAAPPRPGGTQAQGAPAAIRGAVPPAAMTPAMTREDMSAVVREIRGATRSEIDRATRQLAAQATDVRGQLEPLLQEYGGRFLRFARRAAIFAVALYVAYAVLTASVQGSLLEWAGERVDGFLQGLSDS